MAQMAQRGLLLQIEMVKDNWKVPPIAQGSVVELSPDLPPFAKLSSYASRFTCQGAALTVLRGLLSVDPSRPCDPTCPLNKASVYLLLRS